MLFVQSRVLDSLSNALRVVRGQEEPRPPEPSPGPGGHVWCECGTAREARKGERERERVGLTVSNSLLLDGGSAAPTNRPALPASLM